MTAANFRQLLKQQPFRPFRVVMSSGESYDVRHPEMAWVVKNDILIGTGFADDGADDGDDEGIPSEFRICPLLHVATVEPVAL
jgi:hypothetical protein